MMPLMHCQMVKLFQCLCLYYSTPFHSLQIESWHGYIQIRSCDLSKHAGIWTNNNGHTKARWPNGDIQHSRATSLLADLLCPPADRQDKVARFAYKRTIWTNLG